LHAETHEGSGQLMARRWFSSRISRRSSCSAGLGACRRCGRYL